MQRYINIDPHYIELKLDFHITHHTKSYSPATIWVQTQLECHITFQRTTFNKNERYHRNHLNEVYKNI